MVSDQEQTSESFEDVEESLREASQLYRSQESLPKFSKPLELRVVVLSGALPSGLQRPEITGHLVVCRIEMFAENAFKSISVDVSRAG